MPWSGMNPGFLSTIAGLGGLARGYGQGQDQSIERALLLQRLKQQQEEQELKTKLGVLLQNWKAQQPLAQNQGMPPGAGGMQAPQPAGGMAPQGQDPMQLAAISQALGGGGQPPQMRSPQAMGGGMMGQIPGRGTPQREGLVDLLIRDESGGRNINQQVVPAGGGYNPSVGRVTGPSSASGLGQMLDSTWRGTPTAQRTGYARAIDAPAPVQREAINDQIDKRGLADWAPYNKKFAADSKAYLGGLDLPTGGAQQAQSAANQVMNTTPMSAYGSMGMDQIVELVNSRIPANTEPAVRLAMVQMMMPLATEQARVEWDHHKFDVQSAEHQREFDITQRGIEAGREETREWHRQSIGKGLDAGWSDPMAVPADQGGGFIQTNKRTGETRRVDLPAGTSKMGSPAQQMPAELQVPEKWEGMPDKAPPGVRQDIWQASIEYVRTGRMPALGFQAGARNAILQASPAAAKALGVPASKVADLQAAYAGERHGQIVGGGRAAQIALGLRESEQLAPTVKAAAEGIPATDFPKYNQFVNWLNTETGDPNIVKFRGALNSFLQTYTRTVGGTMNLTDFRLQHAYTLINDAMARGQIGGAIDQLVYEMQVMREAVPEAMEDVQKLGQPPALRQPQTPVTPPSGQQKVPKLDADGNVIPD